MNLLAFFFRARKPFVMDRHPGGGFRSPAERIPDPPEDVVSQPRKPIFYYLSTSFKKVWEVINNLFLAILGGIGVVFALVMRMHFVTMLGCVVGIGALCDYNGDHHGLVIGIQIALGIIGFRGFVKMVGPE